MIYLQTYKLFEKSSLTSLGISEEVMKYIQYNYEIPSFAKWNKILYKKDVKEELKKNEVSLFIEINKKYIKVIVNLGKDIYTQQYFMYNNFDWGIYDIRERQDITRTQLLFGIDVNSIVYKLNDKFQERPKVQRKIQNELKKFDDDTKDFKIYILYNFNNIIKRIYGKRYENVMKTIAKNINEISEDANADEILKFLKDNKKMAEKAKEYEDAKNNDDLLKIKNLDKQFNSLPVLDEYLLNFEEGYSEKYNNRLSISNLINDFGRMKIETAFMYYLFTGKLKELSI